ncbi:MAG: algF [Panacagrimonas sp.]|jgi:alginate O-acetyltransferase complex protein AlgF|nr:alginate O-acetyltransferase AlgF [Panacagrimonas sp.]MCC2658187.1 algF [Panacagrimonas sp.]
MNPLTHETKAGHRRGVLSMILALAAVALMTSVVAPAGDGGLYGPTAPPGSAFIRVFNASDADDLETRIGNETIADVGAFKASDFVFLPAGTHQVSGGGASKSVSLSADRYYTAVIGGGNVRLLDNDNTGSKLKALVILYNLTGSAGLSLRTQDGGTVVIPDVANDASGKREVNPAKVQLAVYKGDQKLGDVPAVSFTRGQAFSLFVVGDSGSPRMAWAIN